MHKIRALNLVAFFLISGLLIALDSGSTLAQDPTLTEAVSSGNGSLSLNYPAGWQFESDEAGLSITLSNVALSEEGPTLFDVSAGQIAMNLVRSADLATGGMLIPASNDPVYMSGYLSGMFTLLFDFASSSEDGESIRLGDVVQTEINGQTVAYSDLLGSNGGLMRIIVSTKDEELFVTTVVTPQAEIAQWESLVFSIIESLEIHDIVVSDTSNSAVAASAAGNTNTCNNVAQSITVYAEDFVVPSGGENFLLDGNADTGWSSTLAGETWLFVDFNGLQTVTSIQVNGDASSGIPENSLNAFSVGQFLDDGQWENILGATASMQAGNQSYTLDPITTDNFAIFLDSNHGGANLELSDIMVCAQ